MIRIVALFLMILYGPHFLLLYIVYAKILPSRLAWTTNNLIKLWVAPLSINIVAFTIALVFNTNFIKFFILWAAVQEPCKAKHLGNSFFRLFQLYCNPSINYPTEASVRMGVVAGIILGAIHCLCPRGELGPGLLSAYSIALGDFSCINLSSGPQNYKKALSCKPRVIVALTTRYPLVDAFHWNISLFFA